MLGRKLLGLWVDEFMYMGRHPKKPNMSKYSPQTEDRKHGFVRRKFRNARGER